MNTITVKDCAAWETALRYYLANFSTANVNAYDSCQL
jgi:hypothetical protein